MTWTPPTSFPTVPHGAVIAIDTETHCEDLKGRGPQFITGNDYPIGISLAFEGYAEYFPIAHNDMGGCELTPLKILAWFNALLRRPDILMVAANTRFDLEALYGAGIRPSCPIHDIQVIDALLDENQQSYSLNAIALRRGFPGKLQERMELWMIEKGLVKRGTPDYGRMREVPPEYVAEYAAEDAALTLAIYRQQLKEIEAEDAADKSAGARLADAVKLEGDLILVLWNMRREGIPVDVAGAETLNESTKALQEEMFKEHFPSSLDPWHPASLSKWIAAEFGLAIPQTDKEHDSITNEWMEGTGIPQLQTLADWRRIDKIRKDFIEGVVLEWQHKGKLHPSWFQTRGVSYRRGEHANGTTTGRIAGTMPNLTQIPNRNKVWSPKLRQLFVPREGQQWLKADFKTQEPRIILHYAYVLGIEGSGQMVNRYREDPDLDSHQAVADMINAFRGEEPMTRQQVKALNLGLPYHLGRAKLQKSIGCSLPELEELIASYHAGVPYIKPLQQAFIARVRERGWVKTIRGRRRRFTEWENATFGAMRELPLPKEKALAKWPKIKRARDYTGINAAVQGSASDQIKTALVMMHAEGITPMIQVYDEINASVSSSDEARRICQIMETAIPEFTVPHRAEAGLGPNWADAKEKV